MTTLISRDLNVQGTNKSQFAATIGKGGHSSSLAEKKYKPVTPKLPKQSTGMYA